MKKKEVLLLLLDSLFLIVFNIFYFTIMGNDYSVAGWLSYVFIDLSYVLLIATPILIRKSRSREVFGVSLYTIGAVYFLLELTVGIIFILVKSASFKVALLVQIIMLALYAVLLISKIRAKEHESDTEKRKKKNQ